METSALKAIYGEAYTSLRMKPEPAEFKLWQTVLSGYDESDVRGALQAFQASEHGKYPPRPSELKPEADRLARQRKAASAITKSWFMAWKCLVCGYGMADFLSSNDNAPRYCMSPPHGGRQGKMRNSRGRMVCGENMVVVCSQDTRTWEDDR
jgi:rubrerythrin